MHSPYTLLLCLSVFAVLCACDNQRDAELFLAIRAQEPDVYKLPSGLLVKVLHTGDGVKSPGHTDPCSVHYKGTLRDGKKFDSSYDRNSPMTFAPNQVIRGWTEALQLMCEGDKWELIVPYGLAYGKKGRRPKIPAFSTLVFDIELIQVKADGKPCNRNALTLAMEGEL